MSAYDCALKLVCGHGGAKGNPGSNGSLITGPACSAVWNSKYDIGKTGVSGSNVIEEKILLTGDLIN